MFFVSHRYVWKQSGMLRGMMRKDTYTLTTTITGSAMMMSQQSQARYVYTLTPATLLSPALHSLYQKEHSKI